MTMDKLLPILIILISAGSYFWPSIKELAPNLLSSSPEAPPHKEITTVLNFFILKKHKPGIDAAQTTGKFIYDALSPPIVVSNQRKKVQK